jgi:PiT family inorganic phosphate transporter
VGVPVSTSQAIVGAVLGIGLAKSVRTINRRVLYHILAAWVATPLVAGIGAYVAAMVLG